VVVKVEDTGEEDAVLRIEDLRTYFRTDEGVVRAVDGVSMTVRKGECLGVVGESGSGKSVTQISVLGLVPSPPGEVVGGRVLFHDKDLLTLSQRELRKIRGDRISMIWQDPMTSLNPFLRVGRQLIEPLEVHRGMPRNEAKKRAIEMMEKVGISDADRRFRQFPHQFSGGMRQRVMIAMALLCEPELLIADEPTTALDVTIQAQILDIMRELRQELDMSMVLITHDLGVVAGMADRVVVMYAGKVMEVAPVSALFYRPGHPYTVGLLKSLPRLDRASEKLVPIDGRPPDVSQRIDGCPYAPRCPWSTERCTEEFPETVVLATDHESSCWRAEEVFFQELGTQASLAEVSEAEDQAQLARRQSAHRQTGGGDA
jgi:oligopeptide transport system ATP-binding protein